MKLRDFFLKSSKKHQSGAASLTCVQKADLYTCSSPVTKIHLGYYIPENSQM